MEQKVIEKVKLPIKELVEQQNLFLYDLEFVKEDGIYFLRVSIEKADKTMDFATCEIISEKVSELLDRLDPIEHEYILEVCSPGAERPLKTKQDYFDALNSYVHVELKEAVNKKYDYTGDLVQVNEQNITLNYKDKTRVKTIVIEFEKIQAANLAVKF